MNSKLKNIASKYSINHDEIPYILDGLKVKDDKKLDDKQLEGFENVCRLLKQGQTLDQAIAQVVEQARNDHGQDEEASSESPTQNLIQENNNEPDIEQGEFTHDTDIEATTTEQPEGGQPQQKAAQSVTRQIDLKELGLSDEQISFLSQEQVDNLLNALATVSYAQRQQLIAKFLLATRQKLDQALRSPQVREQFRQMLSEDIVPPHLLEGMPKIQFTLPGN